MLGYLKSLDIHYFILENICQTQSFQFKYFTLHYSSRNRFSLSCFHSRTNRMGSRSYFVLLLWNRANQSVNRTKYILQMVQQARAAMSSTTQCLRSPLPCVIDPPSICGALLYLSCKHKHTEDLAYFHTKGNNTNPTTKPFGPPCLY